MSLIVLSIASVTIGFVLGHIVTVLHSREEEYISLTPKGLQSLKEHSKNNDSPRDDAY